MEEKKIIFRNAPQQVLSDNLANLFPLNTGKNPQGQMQSGAMFVIPHDPSTGCMGCAGQYNPVSQKAEMVRTALTFKTWLGKSAVGPSAVWTPAAGKRIRLMGFSFNLSKESTAAAGFSFNLLENAAVFYGATISAAALTAPGVPVIYTVELPTGGIPFAVDAVLNVATSAVLTAGNYDVVAWGVEE